MTNLEAATARHKKEQVLVYKTSKSGTLLHSKDTALGSHLKKNIKHHETQQDYTNTKDTKDPSPKIFAMSMSCLRFGSQLESCKC